MAKCDSNFKNYPPTRIGALIFVILMLILAIIPGITKWYNEFRHNVPRFAPILDGFLFGFWLHFIPCIWWKCDWNETDCEQVRGAIWFGSWAIVTIISYVTLGNEMKTKNSA